MPSWHSGKRPFPECQDRALGGVLKKYASLVCWIVAHVYMSRIHDRCPWLFHDDKPHRFDGSFLVPINTINTKKHTTECLQPTVPRIIFSRYNQYNKEQGCNVDQFIFLLQPIHYGRDNIPRVSLASPSAKNRALGKENLPRVLHSGKRGFPECRRDPGTR